MKSMKPWFVLYVLVLLTGCSGSPEIPPSETQIFPPRMEFTVPPEEEPAPLEESLPPREEEEEEEVRRQMIPEYAIASSSYPSSPSEAYTPDGTFDGHESTVWVENGEGFGGGEWVEQQFSWATWVQECWIYNGHSLYPDKYATITEIALSFSNGEEKIYGLAGGWNKITLPDAIMTTSVRVTILNANTIHGGDSAIGEIKLFNLSDEAPTEQLGKETVLKNMGALGDCSNITPEQAQAFATQLESVIQWAKERAAERAPLGQEYTVYTGEALLFSGGDGIPVLYYDYDFVKIEELFITETDVVVWDGETAQRSFFETAGTETNINWILPGYVYDNNGEYYFGLTEFDLYGSGSFGLIAMVGFDGGIPRPSADYVAFLSHTSRGAYTYEAELRDYLKMPYLSTFPTEQLETLVTGGKESYFEFNGTNFYEKNLVWNSGDYNTWLTAVRQARIDAGYVHVSAVQSGDVVLSGLQTLASGIFEGGYSRLEIVPDGAVVVPNDTMEIDPTQAPIQGVDTTYQQPEISEYD